MMNQGSALLKNNSQQPLKKSTLNTKQLVIIALLRIWKVYLEVSLCYAGLPKILSFPPPLKYILFSSTSQTPRLLPCWPHRWRDQDFSYLLCRYREMNSHQFSCISFEGPQSRTPLPRPKRYSSSPCVLFINESSSDILASGKTRSWPLATVHPFNSNLIHHLPLNFFSFLSSPLSLFFYHYFPFSQAQSLFSLFSFKTLHLLFLTYSPFSSQ